MADGVTMSKPTVSRHKAVYITYSVSDPEGNILEQSDVPVGYVQGAGSDIFEKIETALEGCTVGDAVEVTLPPEQGFGAYRPELTYTDDLDNVPPEFRRVGAEVSFSNDQDETINMVVTRIENGKLTLDGNHPFAGKTVIFRVTVAAVRDATPEEVSAGVPEGGTERLH